MATVSGGAALAGAGDVYSDGQSSAEDVAGWDRLLVRTRLHPPLTARGTIARNRLDAVFGSVQRKALTIVRAPAGYGKSSILAQWFERLRGDGAVVGWLSMDRTDDGLAKFFYYLIAAVRECNEEFARRMSIVLRSAQRPSVERVRTAFCNAVLDLGRDLYLFVDDFHLAADPEIAEVLRGVLDMPPENLHVILATRHALPFSVSYLRSKGMVAEVDGETLRFDREEASQFLSLAGQDGLSDDDVQTLVSRTEGWVAGLQLASISLARRPTVDSFFSFLSGSHVHLSEYLADDVLDSQLPGTLDFLIETSILSRLSPALCAAVTGRANAREEIELLEKQGLFLFSLDSERTWYRYHHLFAQFLRRRLNELHPGMVPTLHRRASDWFATHGMIDEAFSHAIDAGDMVRAGELFDRSCNHLFYKGGLSTLLRWADRIPADVLRHFPRARLEVAWSIILEWRFDAAARIIREVEEMVAANQGHFLEKYGPEINAIIMHRKIMLSHFMDENAKCDEAISQFRANAQTGDMYLMGNIETCSLYTNRESYRLSDLERMDSRARDFYDRAGSIFVLVWHETILGPTYFLRGDAELAEKALKSAISMAEMIDGGVSPLVAMPALLLAELMYERNELGQVRDLLDAYGPYAEKQGFIDHLVSFYVTAARLRAMDGDLDGARQILRTGRASAARHGFDRLRRFVDQEDMRLAVRASDMDTVKRYLSQVQMDEIDRFSRPSTHTTSGDEAAVITWARAMCAVGDHATAIQVLRRWAAFVGGRGATRSEVRLLLVLAVSLAQDSREGEALRALREAVKKAARPRFVGMFLDEGPAVEALLAKLFKGGDELMGPTTSFGLELMRLFARQTTDIAPDIAAEADDPEGDEAPKTLPDQLNEREVEVLRLVALGMSNKEIGDRLGLTEGSVKWYLQQIFLKLDVRRRAVAVTRARKFGII